jgi:hypothetical protein
LTIDNCDNFIDEIGNLQSGEMKEIGMLIEYRIWSSQGNEQKIRCEQAMILVDRLEIYNDSIWMYYYQLMTYCCYENLARHANNDKNKIIWSSCTEKYIRLMNSQFWKEKNYPDRIWIIYYFTRLCYCYNVVSKKTIDLVIKWIDEVKVMDRGTMSESEWNKSKMWIERSEIEIEICKLLIDWNAKSRKDEANQFCRTQLKKLNYTIDYEVLLTWQEIRYLQEGIVTQSNYLLNEKTDDEKKLKKQYCIEMLNRLDRIRINKEEHWICYYRWITNYCYTTLARIVTDSYERQVIANRMQLKYRQLIDISNEIFSNELNHPSRIVIMHSFVILYRHLFKHDASIDSIEYLQSIIKMAKSLPKKWLTQFEFENIQWLFNSIEKFI